MAAHGGRPKARARAVALLAAGAAGLSGLAMAGTASAQRPPIRHIVVLYLEIHTFDNVLGYWCGHHHGRCPDGGMPSSVTLSDGSVVTPDVLPDIVPKVSHSVAGQRSAIDGGKMDAWQKLQGCTAETGYACIGGTRPFRCPIWPRWRTDSPLVTGPSRWPTARPGAATCMP